MESLFAACTSIDSSCASAGPNSSKARENRGEAIRRESVFEKFMLQGYGSIAEIPAANCIKLSPYGLLMIPAGGVISVREIRDGRNCLLKSVPSDLILTLPERCVEKLR